MSQVRFTITAPTGFKTVLNDFLGYLYTQNKLTRQQPLEDKIYIVQPEDKIYTLNSLNPWIDTTPSLSQVILKPYNLPDLEDQELMLKNSVITLQKDLSANFSDWSLSFD